VYRSDPLEIYATSPTLINGNPFTTPRALRGRGAIEMKPLRGFSIFLQTIKISTASRQRSHTMHHVEDVKIFNTTFAYVVYRSDLLEIYATSLTLINGNPFTTPRALRGRGAIEMKPLRGFFVFLQTIKISTASRQRSRTRNHVEDVTLL
jgi:hypothetical protein